MPKKAKSRFWRKCRVYFRRARITVWVVTLIVLGLLVYLNQIGLPGFVKRPILAKLRERGVALEFSELRLHWSRGFVASRVSSGSMDNPLVPYLTAREVEVNLHLRALLLAKLQVDSIAIRDGKLEWTLTQTNVPDRKITVENIETSLRLLPDDSWMLDDLRGQFGGAKFFMGGSLVNASAVRGWDFLRGGVQAEWPKRLRRLADILDQIAFDTPPEIRLQLNGDARDLRSIDAKLSIIATDADTAWGKLGKIQLIGHVFPAVSNEVSRAEFVLQSASTATRWATATNLEVKLRLVSKTATPDLVEATATIKAAETETPWSTAGGIQAKLYWVHSVTNPVPRSVRLELHGDYLTTWMTRLGGVEFSASFLTVTNPMPPDAALGLWTNLLPYQIQWAASVEALRALSLQMENVSSEGEWNAPLLSIGSLKAALFRGSLDAKANLDVVSRELSFESISDFDVKKLATMLPQKSQEWLGKFSWENPPHLFAAGLFVLPEWTNRQPDWQEEIHSSLKIAGEVSITNGSYQGIHADWAHTHFTYTNFVWSLPDMEVGRPEGGLTLSHKANDATREYYFNIHSTIDLNAVTPLLDPEVRRGFDLCEFVQPPVIDGELWGRWYDHDNIGFRGRVALTNVAFRGQTADAIVAGVSYTNLVIEAFEPSVWRGTQTLHCAGIKADFNTMRLHFTNGFSTLDPVVVVRAIGPNVTRVMEPYHFGRPPVARFDGYVPMRDPHDANIHFEGTGEMFESMRFKVPRFSACVDWVNNLLTITNAQGEFYGGSAGGWAHFVFDENDRGKFAFGMDATNANLHSLVADLTLKENSLEGLVNCHLTITDADTDDIHSWNGYGHAELRDGLLWKLPIFGVLSKPLDAIMPGLGNSRFSDASFAYTITNSVIYSDNLKMFSPTIRLKYLGTVDFDGQIDARVTASFLRDTPVVGPVLNVTLWPVTKLFAYQITGTMNDPKSEPVNIPNFLMIPLSPFRTLEEIFSTDKRSPAPLPEIK